MFGASGPLGLSEKRTAIEMLGFQQHVKDEDITVRWVHGEANLADSLTKPAAKTQLEEFC